MVTRTARTYLRESVSIAAKGARLLRVFRFQMVDVNAVGIRERRAFDEENILGVELSATREVIGAGDHGIIDQENFVVHVIVAPGRCVGR